MMTLGSFCCSISSGAMHCEEDKEFGVSVNERLSRYPIQYFEEMGRQTGSRSSIHVHSSLEI